MRVKKDAKSAGQIKIKVVQNEKNRVRMTFKLWLLHYCALHHYSSLTASNIHKVNIPYVLIV